MTRESDLKSLQQKVEKSRELVHRSEIKVEELAASLHKMNMAKPKSIRFAPSN